MYIIEKIIKICSNLKKNKYPEEITADFGDNYVMEDVITCKHHFLPIDSTGEILACSKCGFLIKKERLNKEE